MAFTPLTQYPNYGTVSVTSSVGIPATLAASGTYTSPLIPGGFGGAIAGVTSTQTGVLTIQRYADLAGLVPVGPVSTQTLTANTAAWTGFADGLPYICFAVTVTNTGGSTATFSNVAILLGPMM